MSDRLFAFISHHKVLVLAAFLGVTLFFGFFAAQIQFNNTIETYFVEGDLAGYNMFLDQFGTDEIIVVAYETDDAFSVENLRLIDNISRELEILPHVRRVLSLTTVELVYGEGDTVHFDNLMEEIPTTAEEISVIRRRAMDDPMIPETIVSRDGTKTAIIAEIDHIVGEFDYKVELLTKIRSILVEKQATTGESFSMGGTAVLDDTIFRYTKKDQTVGSVLMVIVIILTMFLMFRQIAMTTLPLLVVMLTTVWTYGFMVLLGLQLNIIATIIGPLILAVGIADSMHIVADFLQKSSTGKATKTENIADSFKDLFMPCLMTSVTTMFGLLSLVVTDLAPLREFGLVSASGVFFAFLISIFLLPVLLHYFPAPKERHQMRIRDGIVSKMLIWLGRWRKGEAIIILLIVIGLSVPAISMLFRLRVGTNTMDYFRKDDPVRVQTEWIDANIGGTTSLEFLIEAQEEDAFKNPALLEKMESFQEYLETIEGVTGAYSVVDIIKSLNKAFNEGDEREFKIPATYGEVAQQIFIVEGSEDFDAFLSYDYSRARIMARVEITKSQEFAHKMPEIEHHMKEIFADEAEVTPTGMIYLMHKMENYILSSQVKSFLLAFIVISVMLILVLRSFKLGMLAMIPNLLPILFTMALMPLLGISLDIGTVMVAGVAMGLVVDDTIHFLSRLRHEMTKNQDMKTCIAESINHAGRPIIFTSCVLSLGFGVMVFASFNPIINFGILSGIVILYAVFFDLVVLPAALGFTRNRQYEDQDKDSSKNP